MALINRFEVINYLDKIGDSGKWQPNFRVVHFNMQGLSSLIRMDNGQGKTSMASALYLLLTRHRKLAAEVRQKMSPSGLSSWSHIRVEVVVNDESQPLFVGALSGVTGETWVFGVCGHREDGLKFYFYPGRLEDLPAAHDYGDRIKVLSNKEFYDNQKLLERVRWEPSMEDYNAALSSIFPPRAFQLGLDLHLRGGAENDDIFPVKGKNPASELFYAHIAPHLLASDIPPEEKGEEGEYFFEETIINSAQQYGRATIQTEKSRKTVEKFEKTVNASSRLRASTVDAKKKEASAKDARKGTDIGLILLDKVIQEQAIPGIPNDNVPDGLLGELVEGLVWHASERELCLQDSAISKLTGRKIHALNQEVMRSGFKGFAKDKGRLVLSPSATLAIGQNFRGKVYPLESVSKILDKVGVGFPEKLSIDDVQNMVLEAANWWRKHCDTNPARVEAKRLQGLVHTAEENIQLRSDEIERQAGEEEKLSSEMKEVEQGQSAWQFLANSNFFTDAELKSPGRLKDVVTEAAQTSREELNKHLLKKARLEPLSPSHDKIQGQFPGNEPDKVLQEQIRVRTQLRENEDGCRDKLTLASQVNTQRTKAIQNAQRALDSLHTESKSFERWGVGNKKYTETFPGEDPKGLEAKVQKELRDATGQIATATTQKSQVLPFVALVKEFDEKHPGEDCVQLVSKAEKDIEQLHVQEVELQKQQGDAQLKLEDLRQHKIAPTPLARKACELVTPEKKLHEVLCECGLPLEKMAQVLSSFSSVLFAPVFSRPEDAGKAVNILEQEKLPVPVFLEQELRLFAEKQEISCIEDIFFSHHVGRQTLTVATIVDPEKIHQLIEQASQELSEITGALTELAEKKQPRVENLNWLREVLRAINSGAKDNLQELEQKLSELNSKLPRLNERASEEALEAIRARREYLALGGDARQAQISADIEKAQEGLTAAEKAQQDSENEKELAEEAERIARAKRREFEDKWSELETMLKEAVQFASEDGPEFMARQESVEKDLQKKKLDAEERLPFDFESAQKFVDSKENFQDLNRKLKQLRDSIKSGRQELAGLEKEKGRKQKAQALAWERMYRIDEGVAGLLGLWIDFYGAINLITRGVTVQSLDNLRRLIAEKSPKLQPFFNSIDRISDNANKENGAEKILQSFGMISETLNEIGRKIDEVRRKQREADNANKTFRDECQRYIELAEGLAVNEKEIIVTAEDNYDDVLGLLNNLEAICRKEKAKLDELERGLEAITSKAHERLVSLLDSAEDNLRLLKKVADRTAEGTIIVECSTISSDELKNLIRQLLAEVETELRFHQERATSAFPESDRRVGTEWKKSLKSRIADWFYKGVFPTAKVQIRHTSVRGGKPITFRKEGISSGERLAIALVVIGKLQEFIQEREVYWQAKGSGRRRKRGKTQGILLLDGIFSKLSQKEMIQVAMDAYRGLKGSFQLIGLNHYAVENDKDVFPNYFEVRKVSSTTGGFLALDNDYNPISPEEAGMREGELAVARATIIPDNPVPDQPEEKGESESESQAEDAET